MVQVGARVQPVIFGNGASRGIGATSGVGSGASRGRGASRGVCRGSTSRVGIGSTSGQASGAGKGSINGQASGASRSSTSGSAVQNVGEKRTRGGGSSRPPKLPLVGGKGK